MNLSWIGIGICLVHSAVFSGLNIGFFGLSRLRLIVQAENQDKDAARILHLRKDSHLLLATLLWGNVASNVLLALFADSIFTGVGAFFFSTIGITFFGEIIPQAYFVRHAQKTSIVLVPIVRLYQILLYPIIKPTAMILDRWLGKEEASFFQEHEIRILLEKHANDHSTDVEVMEATGAINFLKMDDIKIEEEGEIVHPKSILQLSVAENHTPIFPKYDPDAMDPFLQKINASEKKWIIFVDDKEQPLIVLNADQFLRDVLYKNKNKPITNYCHTPIIVRKKETLLGDAILKFKVEAQNAEDDVVDQDVILYWSKQRRIITGADILGRLLRGIVEQNH